MPAPLPDLLLLNAHLLKHIMGHGVGLRQFCDMARAYHALHGSYSPVELEAAYRRTGLLRWSAQLHTFLTEHLGLPRDVLPYAGTDARTSPRLLHIVLEGGNFGQYGKTRAKASVRLGAEAAHLPLLLEAPRLLRRLRARGGVLDLDKTHNRKPQMRNEYFFRVAGLLFSVSLPSGWDAEALLPSFRPFRCGACPEGKRIFRLLAATLPFAGGGERAELLGESSNDMGHVRLLRTPDGYRTEISYGPSAGAAVHVMVSDPAFDNAAAFLRPEDPLLGRGALVHAAHPLRAGRARPRRRVRPRLLRLAGGAGLPVPRPEPVPGKSTHARRWMEAFPGCRLLNDDNPVLRVEDGTVTAYGTPWSGKTPCYRNECAPVAGIVRLQQSPQNRFTPLCGPEAFAALLPSCSAVRRDARLQDALHDTLVRVAGLVPVGWLECLPDREAARLCLEELNQIIQQ